MGILAFPGKKLCIIKKRMDKGKEMEKYKSMFIHLCTIIKNIIKMRKKKERERKKQEHQLQNILKKHLRM